MSILINLLPDTRQAKLRAARRRQLATGIAVGLWVVCGGIVTLLSLSSASQKFIITTLTNDISRKQTELRSMDGLSEALTAQQHLLSLSSLYDKRVYMTKFLQAYSEANPKDLSLTSFAIDEANALTVSGTSKNYASVAKLARALEAMHIKIGTNANEGNQPYFTDVSIQSGERTNNAISFTINATLESGVTSGN